VAPVGVPHQEQLDGDVAGRLHPGEKLYDVPNLNWPHPFRQVQMNATWGGVNSHYGDGGATIPGYFDYDHWRISFP
jgi:hypothetical protein